MKKLITLALIIFSQSAFAIEDYSKYFELQSKPLCSVKDDYAEFCKVSLDATADISRQNSRFVCLGEFKYNQLSSGRIRTLSMPFSVSFTPSEILQEGVLIHGGSRIEAFANFPEYTKAIDPKLDWWRCMYL